MTEYTFYQIECNGKRYVGSTIVFDERKKQHEYYCNKEKSSHYNLPVYQYIRANGGWYCCEITILEKCNYERKRDAEMREEYWRIEKDATLNSQRCYITEEEQKIYKKKCRQNRYYLFKDRINLKRRQKFKQEKLKKQMLLELLKSLSHSTNYTC